MYVREGKEVSLKEYVLSSVWPSLVDRIHDGQLVWPVWLVCDVEELRGVWSVAVPRFHPWTMQADQGKKAEGGIENGKR